MSFSRTGPRQGWTSLATPIRPLSHASPRLNGQPRSINEFFTHEAPLASLPVRSVLRENADDLGRGEGSFTTTIEPACIACLGIWTACNEPCPQHSF